MTLVPWGEWRPDVSDFNGEHSQTIYNVIPRGDGYGPIKDIVALTSALPAACKGMFVALASDGTPAVFAGTATKLYKLSNSDFTWGDVSKTSGSNITLTGLTSIGNLTGGGGLAAAFDGTTAQAIASCASLASTTSGYVGKTFTSGTAIRSASVYGSNDQGYVSGANPSTTLTLYGKQGTAPANATDGTSIGTATFSDTADEHVARTITSTDGNTLWDHCWITVSTASSSTLCIAELTLVGTASYSVATANLWNFGQMGSVVLATQQNDVLQGYTLGSSSAFANVAGSPPQASYLTIVNEHVVLSGLLNNPFRIAWSARSDTTGWTAGTNGSDTQDFADGGIVRGIAGGELDGLTFQDNAIRRMTYVGGDIIFDFARLTNDKGLRAPYSLIKAAGRTFFLSASGFEQVTGSDAPVPIGKERFDRTFFAEWDDGYPALMQGVYDPRSTRVYWFYKSAGSSTTTLFDKAIVWDWALERGTRITGISGECVGIVAQPGLTLDTPVTSNIDTFTLSLDDISASLGINLAIANSSHQIGFLTGNNLEGILESADAVGGKRIFVRGSRPISDAGTVYGSVWTRQKSSDTPTQSTETTMNAVGFTPHRVDTRHARFRNRIPASTTWSYSIGVDPDVTETGER